VDLVANADVGQRQLRRVDVLLAVPLLDPVAELATRRGDPTEPSGNLRVDRARLRARLAIVTAAVRSEKLGEVASEFDQVHSVERALRVGSVRKLVSAARLRPALIDAVERGIRRELECDSNAGTFDSGIGRAAERK
jgi:hypothetical protein